METALQVRQQLHQAASALAGTCDGAAAQDQVGYSKAHTYNGRMLAMMQVSDWDPDLDWAIWDMLRHYKQQLDRLHGIDFDAIPEPQGNGREQLDTDKRLIWVLAGCWIVEFPYSAYAGYRATISSHGGSFNGSTDPKRWEFMDSAQVREMIGELVSDGFYFTTEAAQLLAQPVNSSAPAAPPQPQGDLDLLGERFAVTFERREGGLLNAVRDINGRRFDWDALRWDIPVRQHEEVKALLADFTINVTPAAQALLDNPPEYKPANRIEQDEKVLRIYFDYDPTIHARVKAIPGRQYRDADKAKRATGSDEKHWTIPLNQAAEALSLCADFPVFTCGEQVMGLATEQAKLRTSNMQGSRASSDDLQIEGLRGKLFPFQSAGVRYAMQNKRVLIGDQMGLGKTIEALATIQGLDAYPAIIVCPASLKLNWERETLKWLPQDKRVRVLSGRKPHGTYAGIDVLIINYDVLKAHVDRLISIAPGAVIFDESHFIKNYRAQRSIAAKALAKAAPVRLALTGTPVVNRPQELITQLDALGRLDDIGGFWHVARRYCGYSSYEGFGEPQNLEELNLKLRETCFIRRLKSEVLSELPAKTYSTIPTALSNGSEYAEAERDVIAYLRSRKGEGASAAAMAAEAIVKLNTLRRLTGEGKIEAAIKWIENFLQSGEKLIVFAHHVAVSRAIAEHFSAPMIIGGVSARAKDAAVQAFQNDPGVKIIVGNLKAMGTGLTLTAASHVLLIEYAWTPADLEQAEDRAHRIGQVDNVTCYYLSAPDTIDGYFEIMLERKRAIVQAVTEGNRIKEASVISEMIDALLAA